MSEEDDLPEGWVARKDATSGRWFYVNREKRRTQWERPRCSEKKTDASSSGMTSSDDSSFASGKISSAPADMQRLHEKYKWIPGACNIRPTIKSREIKARWLNEEVPKYRGVTDLIFHSVFGLPAETDGGGQLFVSESARKRIGRVKKFMKNMFPYDLPRGTQHFVMWYSFRKPDDVQITKDIKACTASEFVWYINPKMTLPEVFHVQVFVRSDDDKGDSEKDGGG